MTFNACISMNLSIIDIDFVPSINYRYEELQILYDLYTKLTDIFRASFFFFKNYHFYMYRSNRLYFNFFLFNISVFNRDGTNSRSFLPKI